MADDLWAELQAAEAVERQKSRTKITGAGPRASTLNALSERTKVDKKKNKNKGEKKKKKKKKAKDSSVSSTLLLAVPEPSRKVAKSSERERRKKPSVEIPPEDHDSVEKVLLRLQRHINELSSEALGKRKNAISTISEALFQPFEFQAAADCLESMVQEMRSEAQFPASSSVCQLGYSILPLGTLSELLFAHLLKPLVRRFTDPSEVCREQAVLLLIKFLAHVEDFTRALPYVFPALMERVPPVYFLDEKQGIFVEDRSEYEARIRGRVTDQYRESNAARYESTTVVEPAEEVRLRLAQTLWILHYRALLQDSQAQVYPYIHDSAILLQAAAVDPFADIKVLACDVIRLLSQSVPALWKAYCVPMVRRIMSQLAHRHARVRVAILDAIDACVQCEDKAKCRGAGSEAINDLLGHRDANVLPVAAFYGADVRVNRFAKLSLDGNVAVRRRFVRAITDWAHNLPDRIDHQARLLPYLLGALHDENPAVRTDALEQVDRMGRQYEEEHEKEVLDRKQYGFDGDKTLRHGPLPSPFADGGGGRPPLGSRMFVRHWARRFLKPVLAELGAWQRETRLNAAYMFRTIVIYMEDHISMSLLDVIKAVLRYALDPDIGDVIRETASYLGRFILPHAWVELLLPHVTGTKDFNPNSSTLSQASAVVFVTQMARECSPARLLPSFTALLEALDPRSTSAVAGDAFFLGLSPAPMLASSTRDLLRALSEALRTCGAAGAAREIFTQTGRLHDVDKINRRLFRLQLLARSRADDDLAAATQLSDADGIRAARAALAVVDAGIVDLGHALSSTAGLGLADGSARDAAFRTHAASLLADAAALYTVSATNEDGEHEDAVSVVNRIVVQLISEIPTHVLVGGAENPIARGAVGALQASMGIRLPTQWKWTCQQTRALLAREDGVIRDAIADEGTTPPSETFSGRLSAHLLAACARAGDEWLRPFAKVSTAAAASAGVSSGVPARRSGSKMVIEEDDDAAGLETHASSAAALAASQAECLSEFLLACIAIASRCQARHSLRIAGNAAARCLEVLHAILGQRLRCQADGTAAAFPRDVRANSLHLLTAFEENVALSSQATVDFLRVLALGLDEPDDILLRRTIRFLEKLLRTPCRLDVGNPAAAKVACEILGKCLTYAPVGASLLSPADAISALQQSNQSSDSAVDSRGNDEDLENLDQLWPRLASLLVVAFGASHDVAAQAVTVASGAVDSMDMEAAHSRERDTLAVRLQQLQALQAAALGAGQRTWQPRFTLQSQPSDFENVDFVSAVQQAEAQAKAEAHEPSALQVEKLATQCRVDDAAKPAPAATVDVDGAIDEDGIDMDDDEDNDSPTIAAAAVPQKSSANSEPEDDDYVVIPRVAADKAAAAAAAGKVPRSPKEAAMLAAAAASAKASSTKQGDAAQHATTGGHEQTKQAQQQQQQQQQKPEKYSPESSFLHFKAEGNRFLRGGEVIDAIRAYGMAIAQDQSRAAPYVNRALAHLKMKQFTNAVADCSRALMCGDCDSALKVKALYRRGKARQHLGDSQGFASDLRRALEIEPHNSTIRRELDGSSTSP